MARSTRLNTATSLGLAALTLVALGAACSSNSDDASAPANASGSGGNAGRASSGGASGRGSAGKGAGGMSGTTNGAGASSAGEAGSPQAGLGGMLNQAGAPSGAAGVDNGNAGDTSEGGEAGASSGAGRELVYVVGLGAGISEFELEANGAPQAIGGSGGIVKSERGFPYGIAVSPDQRFLYQVEDDLKLRTYALDEDGALSEKPVSLSSTGGNPDAIAVTNDGKFVYVGDSSGIEIYAIDVSTGASAFTGGALSLDNSVQSLALSPNGKVLYATEPALGVRAFHVNTDSGALTEFTGSPFVKTVFPRGGLELTPNGKFMYASGEGLNAIAIADDGSLILISTYLDDVLSDGYAPNVAITKDGRFVYATQFLTQQPTGNKFGMFSGFSIQADGTLEILDGFPMPLDNAYSAAIDPSSHYLFVGMDDLDLFSVFSIADNGSLKAVTGSPFTAQGFEPLFAFAKRP